MTHATVAPIWRYPLPDLKTELVKRTASALAQGPARPVRIFFRADDVAAPGRNFARMAEVFRARRIPLALAVVPAWLTAGRWEALRRLCPGPELWCWHQHGWRHRNHEPAGKKAEFGAARPAAAIRQDLLKGRRRLEAIMGRAFYPVFTPPWNRAGQSTLRELAVLNYLAVSRSRQSLPPAPGGLPDLAVQVDLHTRKEADPGEGWSRLFAEWEGALATGVCGVMLHHQRMNRAAFEFMDLLLATVAGDRRFTPVHFRDILEG